MKRAIGHVASSFSLLIAPFLLAGCVSFERGYPEKHYFVLEVGRDGVPASAAGTGVLQVATLRVSPRFEGRSFVYRRSESSFESDFYNQFLVSPSSLLTEEVRKELSRSQIFQYVVGGGSYLEPTHLLEGNIDALYGDFRDGSAPQAVLAMEFFLSREGTNGSAIVIQKRYQKAVALKGRSPEALVQGWNEALREILAVLVADLKAAN